MKNCFISAMREQGELCITGPRLSVEFLRADCVHSRLNVIQISFSDGAFKSNEKVISSGSLRNSLTKLTMYVTLKKKKKLIFKMQYNKGLSFFCFVVFLLLYHILYHNFLSFIQYTFTLFLLVQGTRIAFASNLNTKFALLDWTRSLYMWCPINT